MGFDALYFSREHYSDLAQRLTTRTPEMIWRGSDDTPADDLFTGMFELPTYYPPPGFCFDQFCDDEPIMVVGGFVVKVSNCCVLRTTAV
jgi:lysosomal alpha-mannosidase